MNVRAILLASEFRRHLVFPFSPATPKLSEEIGNISFIFAPWSKLEIKMNGVQANAYTLHIYAGNEVTSRRRLRQK